MSSIIKKAKMFTELLKLIYSLDPLTKVWTLSLSPGYKYEVLACSHHVLPQAGDASFYSVVF